MWLLIHNVIESIILHSWKTVKNKSRLSIVWLRFEEIFQIQSI